MGVNPLPCPVETAIAAWKWGAYLGAAALEQGVDVQVSSWTRIAPNTLPALAKTSANYANSQLIKMEALTNGYAEGIALDSQGYVSEGSGENLFLVRDGRLLTPRVGDSILPGITRVSILQLARDLGIPHTEFRVPREALYLADEAFLAGTAAEVTPVRSVDRIAVGNGRPGEITRRLEAAFREIVTGEVEDRHGWLHPV
jgi:branched-chain amino acid aminotransferase